MSSGRRWWWIVHLYTIIISCASTGQSRHNSGNPSIALQRSSTSSRESSLTSPQRFRSVFGTIKKSSQGKSQMGIVEQFLANINIHAQDPLGGFVPYSDNSQGVAIMVGCPSNVFSANVTIGGDDTYRLLVDTGSTTLAVASSSCDTCIGVSNRYNVVASGGRTFGTSVSGSYGDGSSWTGDVIQDYVSMVNLPPVSLLFVSIQEHNNFFRETSCPTQPEDTIIFDGIIGLAYASIAVPPTGSWYAKSTDALPGLPDIFSIQLCQSFGRLWIGGYDTAYMSESIQYTPIVDDTYYVVSLTSITLGSTAITGFSNAITIVDSGTTLTMLPVAVFNQLVALLNSDSTFQALFPFNPLENQGICFQPSTPKTSDELNQLLPPLQFAFSPSVVLTSNAVSSYLLEIEDRLGNIFYCGGVTPSSITILGWTFMNQYITVFDRAEERVGFSSVLYCGHNGTATEAPGPNYKWVPESWSSCSTLSSDNTCGEQTRNYSCENVGTTGDVANDGNCTSLNLIPPYTSQTCNRQYCLTNETFCSDPSICGVYGVCDQTAGACVCSDDYTGTFCTVLRDSGSSSAWPSWQIGILAVAGVVFVFVVSGLAWLYFSSSSTSSSMSSQQTTGHETDVVDGNVKHDDVEIDNTMKSVVVEGVTVSVLAPPKIKRFKTRRKQ